MHIGFFKPALFIYTLLSAVHCRRLKNYFKCLTLNQRKALINYFVNAVVLYDDDAIFYLNYKENALKLSLSKIKKCSDSLLNSLPKRNRHPLGCLFFFLERNKGFEESFSRAGKACERQGSRDPFKIFDFVNG